MSESAPSATVPTDEPISELVTEPIKIDIWSDVACPWCYIGKRRFEAGSAQFAGAGEGRAVEVEFHSFELSPDTPVDFEGGEADYLARHKGISGQQAEQLLRQVTAIAEQVGLAYDFGAVQHTNTVKAHELIHFAKANGRQAEMKERLLRAYFVEGGHVGRIDDLVEYAAEIGLDREDARQALANGSYLPAVREDQAAAVAYGINGVPFYVIDGRYGVSGAQEPATFAQVLEQVWQERRASTDAPEDERLTEGAR